MNDEAVALENLLARIAVLDTFPPPLARTYNLSLNHKELKALENCIYKYLGEKYPEGTISKFQRLVNCKR